MITLGHEPQPPFVFERRDAIIAEARRARSAYIGGLIIKGVVALGKALRRLTAGQPGPDRLWALSTHTLRDIGIEHAGVRGLSYGAQVPFQVANENLPRHVA